MSNHKKIIIGLVGKLQSGKTTSADIILDHLKKDYNIICRYSFGDFLKTMILNAGICSPNELWGKKTEYSRFMMQKIGTEIIRKQVSENFWIDKMNQKIEKTFTDSPYENILVVIDDVRFINEASLINKFNGTLVRIKRPNLNTSKNENKHLSEIEQDGILVEYDIINDGTLNDLKEKLINVVKKFELT